MRRTINISVSERMHEFINRRTREGYHSSVSEYLRSLVREDKIESEKQVGPETYPELRNANDCFPGWSEFADAGCDDDIHDL